MQLFKRGSIPTAQSLTAQLHYSSIWQRHILRHDNPRHIRFDIFIMQLYRYLEEYRSETRLTF